MIFMKSVCSGSVACHSAASTELTLEGSGMSDSNLLN